jgi:hypothetical protein
MENTLTPEESLQIIQKSIANIRRNMRDGAFYFILWGWALILAALTHFGVMLYFIKNKLHGEWWISVAIWMFYVLIAFIWQNIKISRESRSTMVKTSLDRLFGIVWYSSGMVFGLIIFFSVKLQIIPVPFILAVTASATFISGMLIKFRPIILGGIVFALASVISVFFGGMGQTLVVAVSLILGYLIPGYMLRNIKDEEDV